MTLPLALALDALFGEPHWLWSRLPHPAVLIGRLIGRAERHLNTGAARRPKGVMLTALLVLLGWGVGRLIGALPGTILDILIVAILLAQRSLMDHVAAVADGLRTSTAEGRSAVAMIVGRDTSGMDGPAVSRAAIESAAENFSDGVIAPAFWFIVAGLPGIFIYKAINTADSMIGYKTEKFAEFGWAAARLDDALNWIPARLTAGLIWCVSGGVGRWQDIRHDAGLHRSPNAGWPEAAIAPALDVSLSGPRSYDGKLRSFPFVHPSGRKAATAGDIDRAITLIWQAWSLFLALVIGGSLLAALC